MAILGTVQTLAELHGQLAAASNIDEIEIGGFLSNLCSTFGVFALEGDAVCHVHADTETVIVDNAIAIPLGMVANEFITNSLEYATKNKSCSIRINVSCNASEVSIVLRDEDDGFEDGKADGDGTGGSGMSLIDALVAQIGARNRWNGEDGTRLDISTPFSPRKVSSHI